MTLTAISQKLHTDETAVEGMLELLLKRGQVKKITGGDCEGSCGCVAAKVEAFQWVDKKVATPLSIISVD